MKYETLLETVGDVPLFESSLLLAGDVDPVDVASQLSRWTAGGRLLQLRRGLYAIPPPYASRRLDPFETANKGVIPSYVSLHSALSHYGLIPDTVPVVTSVTTRRPQERETALGTFLYRHIKPSLFWGFAETSFGGGSVLLASPEKALLDLGYFEPASADLRWVEELRLQNLDRVDLDLLSAAVAETRPTRLADFAQHVRTLREKGAGWGEWRS